jgi:DNA processing protein
MAGVVLSDRQRLDWLRLIRSEGIGPRTFQALLNRFGSAAQALDALPEIAREAGRSVRICRMDEAEREIAGLKRLGGRLIALGEAAYPAPLRAIDSAPPLLAILGQAEALSRPSVAVVGSRNASAAGLKFTARLARDLGEAGFTVTSGLARGIDTAAHEASLTTGTVAVMAGGLDEIYPPQNLKLFDRLVETGAAVSEMPLGWAPRGRDFPRRNRLVSGLSLGTVVVEAARKSGSLITARFANEQGRQVFAVPGSPLDPRAEGGNHLIREGATLCAEAAHVIEALQPLLLSGAELPLAPSLRDAGDPPSQPLWDELDLPGIAPAPTSPEQGWLPSSVDAAPEDATTALLRLIGHAPIAPDDLVRASGRPAREVTRALLDLEMAGSVLRHPGGLLSRAVR